jgi:hypothetical protein
MRILWTLLKVVIGLAIALPLGVLVLAVTFGVLGALLGLAILALKLAFLALVGFGAYRLLRRALGRSPGARTRPTPGLPAPDPYYRAAMHELDAELGHSVR